MDHAPIKRLTSKLPEGLVASLHATDGKFCSESQADKDNCDPKTKIGMAVVDVQVFGALPEMSVEAGLYMAKPPLLKEFSSGPAVLDGPLSGNVHFIEQPSADDPKQMAIFLESLTRLRIDVKLKAVKVGDKFRIKGWAQNIPQLPVSAMDVSIDQKLIATSYVPSCPASFGFEVDYGPHAWELTKVTPATNLFVKLSQSSQIEITEGCGPPE